MSIELASEDSSNGSLKEILDLAIHEVSKRKAYRTEHDSPTQIIEDSFLALKAPNNTSNEQKQNWAKINNHINVITYNFLQTLRPSSNLDFTAEQIKDISSFLLPAISSLLKEKLNELCQNEELVDLLRNKDFSRCFVLYASEWWKREYSGGVWSWESIFKTIYRDVIT